MRKLNDYFNTEHVMAFLMGLNNSFSQLRTQVLLMKPEPTIQRAFSLIAQEVEQRFSSVPPATNVVNAATVLVKSIPTEQNNSRPPGNSYRRRERPLCTHCGIQSHTIERCYKLHRYPLGHCSYRGSTAKIETHAATSSSSFQGMEQLSDLNTDQCKGLLSLLQSHLAKNKSDLATSSSHVAGTCLESVFNFDVKSWILDSGVSAHICYLKESFSSLLPISGASVSLPNQAHLEVEYIGSGHVCVAYCDVYTEFLIQSLVRQCFDI